MYVAPVGIVNAADPDGAYAEAIDVAGAHQSSYGREAAGVFAAAVAAAMRPGATVTSVVEAAIAVAHDGTRAAIEAVADAAAGLSELARRRCPRSAPRSSRSTRSARTTARPPPTPGGRAGRSRSRSCPIALGMVVATGGDYREAVLGGVNYGRDCRLDRDHGRGDRRCARRARRRPRRLGRARSPRPAGPTSSRPATRWPAVARDIWKKDAERDRAPRPTPGPPCTSRRDRERPGRRHARMADDAAADLGAARGPAAARARRGRRSTARTSTTIERRWLAAGGAPTPPRDRGVRRAGARPSCGRWLGSCSTSSTRSVPGRAARRRTRRPGRDRGRSRPGGRRRRAPPIRDRLLGAWLGRAAGCLLGKPVEKIPRAGIREIAESTGNWPLTGYFTARGLDPDVAAALAVEPSQRGRPAWPRTSTACPRTTTSTSRWSR